MESMNMSFCYLACLFLLLTVVHGRIISKEKRAVKEMTDLFMFDLSKSLPILVTAENSPKRDVEDTPLTSGPCTPNPCLNYGVCIVTGADTYRCDCLPFIAGERCGYGQCIPIPFWPRTIPQPFYKYCTHPEICVLEWETNSGSIPFTPSCVCDNTDLCSEA